MHSFSLLSVSRSVALLLLVASLGACEAESAPEEEVVRPIKTAVLGAASQQHMLTYSGVVRPRIESAVGFRVGGKIFATLQHGLRTGAVMLSPEDQARFVAEAPQVFSPETGAWGRAGSTRVQLEPADEEIVGEALTVAWRRRIALSPEQKPRRAAAKRTGARKATKTR